MKISTSPIPPAFVHLPPIPSLKKEEERGGGLAWQDGAAGPSRACLNGGTVSPLRGMSRPSFLLLGLRRSGLLQPMLCAVATLAGGSVVFVGVQRAVGEEPTGGTPAALFAPAPSPASEPAPLKPDPKADPLRMVLREESPAVPAPKPAKSPAAPETPLPTAAAAQAAPVPPAVPAASELRDALAGSAVSARLSTGVKERLAWTGTPFTLSPAAGGAFREMSSRRTAADGPRGARRLTALRQGSARTASGAHSLVGTTQRAIGQLKLVQHLSAEGARSATAEAAKQGAADAFDQAKTVDGEGLKSDAVPGTGLSASAPDMTRSVPPLPAGVNKTPYQKDVDEAKKANDKTVLFLILGAVLIAAGIGLLVLAHHLEAAHPTAAKALKVAGYALLAAGALMLLLGFMSAMKAKDKAKDVGDKYGQKGQQAVVEQCADQSLDKQACSPAKVDQPKTGVHDAAAEESAAGYSLGSASPAPAAGGPIGAGR